MLKCRTVDPVIFLDSKGRAYTVSAGELPPARGDGAPASSLVEVQEGAHIMYVVGGKPETNVIVASTGGYGFLSKIADMISNRRAGREFMTIEEGETPVPPFMYEDAAGNYVAAISEQGRMLLFQVCGNEADDQGPRRDRHGPGERTRSCVAVAVSDQPGLSVLGSAAARRRRLRSRARTLGHYAGHRARMGRVLPDKLKPVALKVLPKPEEPAPESLIHAGHPAVPGAIRSPRFEPARSLCRHVHIHRHAEKIARRTGEGAGERHRLGRVARDGHADQILAADQPIGRVELDPAGAGQVDLHPGVGRAAAHEPRRLRRPGARRRGNPTRNGRRNPGCVPLPS